jgi:hypothetical protein
VAFDRRPALVPARDFLVAFPCVEGEVKAACAGRGSTGTARPRRRSGLPARHESAAQNAAASSASKGFPWKIPGSGGTIDSRS